MRTRYFDYRCADSTFLLNDKNRGILKSGVYRGFTVSQGSGGGLNLKFTHETDPDNPAALMGAIITPSGVIIKETADQDNIIAGSLVAGTPNIHYVIASYSYNASLPNNDVTYAVVEGTAGAPPVPPTLGVNEVLLCSIYVPLGAINYGAAGVEFFNAPKLDLYNTNLPITNLTGVLNPGIYTGIDMSQGSTIMLVNLSSGTWVTKELTRIVESASQADLFSQSVLGADTYRLSWIIGAHKFQDANPIPDVDYILVEGAAVALAAEAALPSDADIITAASAINPKYSTMDYLNKLGYIRIENRAATYTCNYYKGETNPPQDTIHVYGGENTSIITRSGKYYGHLGLLAAIDDVWSYTVLNGSNTSKPYELLLEGEFKLPGTLHIPSNIKLRGVGGAPCKISSDVTAGPVPVLMAGFTAVSDLMTDTITQAASATPAPAGFVARDFTIEVAFQSGDNLLVRKFSRGDIVHINDPATSTDYIGVVNNYNALGNWSLECFVPTAYNTDGNPTIVSISFIKRNAGLDNIVVDRIGSGNGALQISDVSDCEFGDLIARWLIKGYTQNCTFNKLDATTAITWDGTSILSQSQASCVVNNLKIGCPVAALTISDFNVDFGSIDYVNLSNAVDFNLTLSTSNVSKIRIQGLPASVLHILSSYGVSIGVVNSVTTTIQSTIACIINYCTCTALNFITSTYNTIINTTASVISDPALSNNRVLTNTNNILSTGTFIDHANSDRNLTMLSDAIITWNVVANTLSWDAVIKFDNPWTTGFSEIAIGSAVLAVDGDRLFVNMDRDAAGTTVVATTVLTKAGSAAQRYNKNMVFIAVRYGTTIYLWDGTRIESGQSIKLGQTTPPDGSVTYPKLASSALAFHNEFFRDYITEGDNTLWENAVIFKNSALVGMTYDSVTGIIQYTANVDLSNVVAGDMVILPGYMHSVTNVRVRETIYAVDDLNNTITINKGSNLAAVYPAVNTWYGTIVRGNIALTNDGLSAFTYDPATGTVTYAVPLGFTHLSLPYTWLWVDGAGRKYRILSVDGSGVGAFIVIASNLRDVSTTVSSSMCGAVVVDNNPNNVNLSDLKVLNGMEFIPIDFSSHNDPGVLENPDKLVVINSLNEKKCVHPYDKRLFVYRTPSAVNVSDGIIDNLSRPSYIVDNSINEIEFTSVFTDVALVINGTDNTIETFVDGFRMKQSTASPATKPSYLDNYHGSDFNRYTIVSSAGSRRLSQGIHTVRFVLSSTAGMNAVRGILIGNNTSYESATTTLSDSPGTAVQNGGLVNYAYANGIALPTPSTGWNKGCRFVRYASLLGTRANATTFIRNFTDVGDVSVGSVDIINVHNISQWRVGDILLVVDHATGTKYLHRITIVDIGLTKITLSAAASFTLANCDLYYYGSTFNGFTDRLYEEVAITLPVSEFTSPAPINDNPGYNQSYGARTMAIGTVLSDCSTGIAGSAGLANGANGGIKLDIAGDKIRLYFIGTGLSIRVITVVETLTVTLDGCDLGTIDPSLTLNNDNEGLYICGELPYGGHFIEFEQVGGTDVTIHSFTIWQPRKPVVPANSLELLDTNMLAVSDAYFAAGEINPINTLSNIQIGTIALDGPTLNCLETTYRDAIGLLSNNRCVRYVHFAGSAGTEIMYITFWGKELTIASSTTTQAGANPINVKFLTDDELYTSPSGCAAKGLTVTGPDSLAAGAYTRYRWKLSRVGMHVMSITLGNAGDDVDVDTIEVAPVFHTYKTKQPQYVDHLVPFSFSGNDIRNLSPFRSDYLPKYTSIHSQGANIDMNDSLIDMETASPYIFYTRGGLTKVQVSFVAQAIGPATSIVCTIGIDGISTANECVTITANGAPVSATLSKVVNLAPGFHFANVKYHTTTFNATNFNWSSISQEEIPANIQSRGLGVGLIGPGNGRESSF